MTKEGNIGLVIKEELVEEKTDLNEKDPASCWRGTSQAEETSSVKAPRQDCPRPVEEQPWAAGMALRDCDMG